MNTAIALTLNAVLALATIGALALVVRVALRMRPAQQTETLHPSQPIPLRLAVEEERDLARAA